MISSLTFPEKSKLEMTNLSGTRRFGQGARLKQKPFWCQTGPKGLPELEESWKLEEPFLVLRALKGSESVAGKGPLW